MARRLVERAYGGVVMPMGAGWGGERTGVGEV